MQTYEDTAVKVVYGVNELSLDLGGKSIRGIWKMLEQVLNLPRETTVRVNGQVVADDHIVRPGDEIDFLKPAGVKGVSRLTTPTGRTDGSPGRHLRGALGLPSASDEEGGLERCPCIRASTCASKAILPRW